MNFNDKMRFMFNLGGIVTTGLGDDDKEQFEQNISRLVQDMFCTDFKFTLDKYSSLIDHLTDSGLAYLFKISFMNFGRLYGMIDWN